VRLVYADTSIWNCLCDQKTDPAALCSTLAVRDAGIVLGFNVLYEMAKRFSAGTEDARKRGQKLFTCMRSYLDRRIPIVKENWALLIEEALHVTEGKRIEPYRGDSDYQMAIEEVNKLCEGNFEGETAKFIENRKSAARDSRTTMQERLETRPDLIARLEAISDQALSQFLATESVGAQGQFLLQRHLSSEFPENSAYDLSIVAKILLSFGYRASRVMTRGDLYLNWRCAKRGSIRPDLPDDVFHIVSASYCDVFVTTETDQATIARHAIEGIKAIVCDRNESISDRLMTELDDGTAP
jgi:hypothetical protein